MRYSGQQKTDLRTSYATRPLLWICRSCTVPNFCKCVWNEEINEVFGGNIVQGFVRAEEREVSYAIPNSVQIGEGSLY